jgi:glycine/D-amino acid oxidase-like deaminating enzyme
LERIFPALRGTPYEITSPAEPDYNCIAWAAGDTSRWWEPDESPFSYWPAGVPREYTLQAYAHAFRQRGFEECPDDRLEEGWEKVAIFATEEGLPAHAARQLADGTWTSKLGKLEDIRHPALEHVSGQPYGRPVIILRRPRQAPPPEEANP